MLSTRLSPHPQLNALCQTNCLPTFQPNAINQTISHTPTKWCLSTILSPHTPAKCCQPEYLPTTQSNAVCQLDCFPTRVILITTCKVLPVELNYSMILGIFFIITLFKPFIPNPFLHPYSKNGHHLFFSWIIL